MAELTRTSELFVTKETTENTPVVPSAGNEAVSLRDGFDLEPSFEVLENDSIKASIGAAEPQLGSENPTFSLPSYLKGSGSEGTVPEVDYLLESLMGSVATRSTERNTVASSTTSVIKVDSGEGAEFARGDALLIKDGTNGYSIRNVLSVSTDDLTLGQNVATAPGTGVNLGRNTAYRPANSSHPTLNAWLYRGDGGALEMISGLRVTEAAITANANEQITADYSATGLKYHYNPIVITTSTNDIDFTDDGGSHSATIATAQTVYRDPHEAGAALQTAMNAVATDTITVTYNDTGANAGKFTVASDGSTFTVDWLTTTDTLGAAFGFTADDTGATSYVSDSAVSWAASVTPSFDSTQPLVAKNNQLILSSDSTETSCLQDGVQSVSLSIATEKTPIDNICSETGRSGSVALQRTVTADIVAIMDKDNALAFKDFRANNDVSMTLNFGTKTAGNWDAGKCVNFYMVQGKITAFKLSDADGVVTMELSVQAHVGSDGLGEFYINFV